MVLKQIIIFLTGLLLLFSLLSVQFEIIPNRLLRLGSSVFFFFIAVRTLISSQYWGVLSFLLLVVCDFCLLYWEQSFSKVTYYLSHLLAMGILIFLTVRELKWPKVSLTEAFFLVFFFVINSGILVFLGKYFNSGISDIWLRSLFYTNGFLILLLVMSAFFYSIYFANKVSAFLFLAIMCLTVSDLLIFSIYFIGVEEMRFIDNFFYVLGFCFLINSYNEHKKFLKEYCPEQKKIEEEKAGEGTKVIESPGLYR